VLALLPGMLRPMHLQRVFANPGRWAAVAGGLLAAACGGGSSNPQGPSTPPPVQTYSVAVTVFYDQDENGTLDPGEDARVPGVEVVIGTGSGTSTPNTGLANVTGIEEGAALTLGVRDETLPVYYRAPPPAPIQVPGTTQATIGLTLPIGENHPNRYLGIGDSITAGDGSSDGQGYKQKLLQLLGPYFARAEVLTRGREGDSSIETAQVIRRTLRDADPAYALVLLGTNDWNDQTCQHEGPSACYTIDALRTIVDETKAWHTLPVLATIIPANPRYSDAARDAFNDQTNVMIRALAQQENIICADLSADFKAAGDLTALFDDNVHPNDAGYEVMAQGWFEAITRTRAAAASSSHRFGFSFGR
jgi:lysophospholipase L1-like esterase